VHLTDTRSRLASYAGDGVPSFSDYGIGTPFAEFVYNGGTLDSQSFAFVVTSQFNKAITSGASHLGIRFFDTAPSAPSNFLAQARFRNAVLTVTTPVPEPAGMVLAASLFAVGVLRRRLCRP
jgi:hypothetical protein